MNILKIVFKNNVEQHDENFLLDDNPVSRLWIKKIKHLQHVDVDHVETSGRDVKNLKLHHKNFCKLTGIKFEKLDYNNQKNLNYLHELYEKNHNYFSRTKNSKILYTLHHAIHQKENLYKNESQFVVGWGVKEGPLTTNYHCNKFYSPSIKKNNLYLPWSELGKTPMVYFKNKEPNNIERFIQLARPHITLRPQFIIAREEKKTVFFTKKFNEWFNKYKKRWLSHYQLEDWVERDESSAVLLASPVNNIDINAIISKYPKFHTIKLV